MEKPNSRRIVCSKRILPADPNISKEIYLFAGMTTVFAAKNRAPHSKKTFLPNKEPVFAVIHKEYVLLLTKQYSTIPPLPED